MEWQVESDPEADTCSDTGSDLCPDPELPLAPEGHWIEAVAATMSPRASLCARRSAAGGVLWASIYPSGLRRMNVADGAPVHQTFLSSLWQEYGHGQAPLAALPLMLNEYERACFERRWGRPRGSSGGLGGFGRGGGRGGGGGGGRHGMVLEPTCALFLVRGHLGMREGKGWCAAGRLFAGFVMGRQSSRALDGGTITTALLQVHTGAGPPPRLVCPVQRVPLPHMPHMP